MRSLDAGAELLLRASSFGLSTARARSAGVAEASVLLILLRPAIGRRDERRSAEGSIIELGSDSLGAGGLDSIGLAAFDSTGLGSTGLGDGFESMGSVSVGFGLASAGLASAGLAAAGLGSAGFASKGLAIGFASTGFSIGFFSTGLASALVTGANACASGNGSVAAVDATAFFGFSSPTSTTGTTFTGREMGSALASLPRVESLGTGWPGSMRLLPCKRVASEMVRAGSWL